MTTNYIPHCDVGDHDVTDGSHVLRCAHCNRRLCVAHQGNPDTPLGSMVACVDHIEQVAQMNRVWWQKFYSQASAQISEGGHA